MSEFGKDPAKDFANDPMFDDRDDARRLADHVRGGVIPHWREDKYLIERALRFYAERKR